MHEDGRRNKKPIKRGDIKMKMTIRQTVEKYPFFTENSLRWHLFNRGTNGLAPAVMKIGKKILIDDEKFTTWIDSHGQG
jgi:hypothetical protein